MALDLSALPDRLDALKAADVDDRIRAVAPGFGERRTRTSSVPEHEVHRHIGVGTSAVSADAVSTAYSPVGGAEGAASGMSTT